MAHLKLELANKTVVEKCKALKDLERGLSNKRVAEKYGVPRNTVLTWVKNKKKLLALLGKRVRTLNDRSCVVEISER